MNNVGIIQGRLSPPIGGFQECPDDWEREFDLISTLCLDHIEWIVTANRFDSNPLFHSDLKRYASRISSICCDNLVSEKVFNKAFLEQQLIPICLSANANNIHSLTIPLLDGSRITDRTSGKHLVDSIRGIGKDFPNITFSFEIESSLEVVMYIMRMDDSFSYTYDTGNMAAFGADHNAFINSLGSKISTIHLKDKSSKSMTVIPGCGIVDFMDIFRALIKSGTNPKYTIQTAREDSGNEVSTIASHINHFNTEHEKAHI